MASEISNNSDIKTIIRAIQTKEIVDYFEVPEEYRNNIEIVKIERKMMVRVVTAKGYDVIRKNFFIDELVNKKRDDYEDMVPITSNFETFEEYYDFVEGEIYKNACYYGYVFPDSLIKYFKIDISRLNFLSLISNTVDNCYPHDLWVADYHYDNVEMNKRNIKRWITKYNACKTYEELKAVNERHDKSSDETDALFYFWNYIIAHGISSFDIVMSFVNAGVYPAYMIEPALPFLYDLESVRKAYNYNMGAKSTCARHKAKFKMFIKRIKEEGYYTVVLKYFCRRTHFYCVQTDFYFKGDEMFRPCASTYRYFDDFVSFSKYLNNDLSDCDLTYAKGIKVDSAYKTNENTRLPIDNIELLKRIVEKKYDRYKDEFSVIVKWNNSFGKTVFEEPKSFRYFFDFLAYLKNDLSNADLLYCDGLINLQDYKSIDFTDAVLTSKVLDAMGDSYENKNYISTMPVDNEMILFNEQKTALLLNDTRLELPAENGTDDSYYSDNKVYYITDIHILHKLIQKEAKTQSDIVCVLQRIVDDILFNIDSFWKCSTLLIGGDVVSEFELFDLFVDLLRKTMDERLYDITVVFVLGNHELWNHEGEGINEIVEQYRDCIESRKMYLLSDEVIYIENKNDVSHIDKDELLLGDVKDLRFRTRKARLILFGGIGFSGCNEKINANEGIYGGTINRDQEVILSSAFSDLYDRVEGIWGDRSIVVFTHMSVNDWKSNCILHDKWIYVNGHNHINTYYDDGSTRLYADNQIGYYNDRAKTKYFLIDNSYDWFVDFEDGIYEISKNDYIEFYRGKNIPITFNRDVVKIYMLKRHGYYCFIHKSIGGKLSMLNGGALKGLVSNDIDYYYNNMDEVIEFVKTPLSEYQDYQKVISEEIKRLGGSGRIHGAIIDVDGYDEISGFSSISYSHLYVNPIDLTITPYYAWDMREKYVYHSFHALIRENCPKIYENYKKLPNDSREGLIVLNPVEKDKLMEKPEFYPDTGIYKASRELRKMQKLNSNILSTWYDNIPNLTGLPEKKHIISDNSKA